MATGGSGSNRPFDDHHHHDTFTTSNYPHSLRTRGTSPYAPNRATTINPTHSLHRRPPLPEDFRMETDPQQGASLDEIIETAIVIKNIPFSYPEEDFLQKLFPQLGLVPPYAFNYHRNKVDGAFHGLAFANFQNASEAQNAVDLLNNYELERRRLRVELKKKLPAEEEQRQRLARQSRRQVTTTATAGLGAAFGTTAIGSGPQVQELGFDAAALKMVNLDPSIRPRILYRPTQSTPHTELDMNDPDTLGLYTAMQIFRSDQNAACLEFPPTLTHQQRSIVHTLAARLDLDHASQGVGADRYIAVTRRQTPQPSAPPTQSTSPDPLTFQQYRPMPTTRASTELLTQHPPLSPRQQDLRASRSMTNLRGGNDPTSTLPPSSTMPPPYPRIPTDYTAFTHHDLFSRQSPLGHRASQESTMSSRSYNVLSTTVSQPSRQPHGPVDQSRGFTERPSRESFQPQSTSTAPAQQSPIRPIGHGAKTPSHGSVSHGSGSRESRGGSDSILDLQIQNTIPHEF